MSHIQHAESPLKAQIFFLGGGVFLYKKYFLRNFPLNSCACIFLPQYIYEADMIQIACGV